MNVFYFIFKSEMIRNSWKRNCLSNCIKEITLFNTVRIAWIEKLCKEGLIPRAVVNRKLLPEIRAKISWWCDGKKRVASILRWPERLNWKGREEGGAVIWMSTLTNWLEEGGVKLQDVELLQNAKNRELWQDMIATVVPKYNTNKNQEKCVPTNNILHQRHTFISWF